MSSDRILADGIDLETLLQEAETVEGDLTEDADGISETNKDDDDQEEIELQTFRTNTVSILTCLVDLVSRKLRAISAALYHRCASVEDFQRVFDQRTDAQGRLPLVPDTLLLPLLCRVGRGSRIRPAWEDTASPPSWACLEASQDLEPGWWFPIKAAQLHPCGALCTVASDESDSAFATNPRYSVGDTSDSWVAEHLGPFAGFIPIPQVIRSYPTVRCGQIGIAEGDGEALFLKPHRKYHDTMIITQAIFRRGNENIAPRLLVKPGEYLDEGAPWLAVPKALWSNTSVEEDVPMRRILRTWAGRDIVPSDLHLLRTPQSGKVVFARIETRKNGFGILRGWLAKIEISFALTTQPFCLSSSGQLIAGTYVEKEDLPFDPDTGEPVDGVVSGLGIEPCDDLRSGQTGELRLGHSNAHIGEFPILESGPSGQMSFRLLDGSGIAPQKHLAIGPAHWRWLMLRHPGVAEALNSENARWGPSEPSHLEAIRRLLNLVNQNSPKLGKSAADYGEDKRFDTTERTIITNGGRWAVSWRCECGELNGQGQIGKVCLLCDQTVITRRAKTNVPLVRLPVRVVHPWKHSHACELLDLTEERYREILADVSPEVVVREIERRGASLELNALGHFIGLSGRLAGSDRLVVTTLAHKLREVVRIADLVLTANRELDFSFIVVLSNKLQEAIDDYAGRADQSHADETIAGWILGILPSHRSHEIGLPNLVHQSGQLQLLTEKGPLEIPKLSFAPRSQSERGWRHRFYLSKIYNEDLVFLATIFGGLPQPEISGDEALVWFLARLEDGFVCAERFYELLHRLKPLSLPENFDDGCRRLAEMLSPESESGPEFTNLQSILGLFAGWILEDNNWVFDRERRGNRYIPPRDAWRTFSFTRLAFEPVNWLLQDESLSALERRMLGLTLEQGVEPLFKQPDNLDDPPTKLEPMEPANERAWDAGQTVENNDEEGTQTVITSSEIMISKRSVLDWLKGNQ